MTDSAQRRLSVMMFLEYVIWGCWLPLLALYLSRFLGFTVGGGVLVGPLVWAVPVDEHTTRNFQVCGADDSVRTRVFSWTWPLGPVCLRFTSIQSTMPQSMRDGWTLISKKPRCSNGLTNSVRSSVGEGDGS